MLVYQRVYIALFNALIKLGSFVGLFAILVGKWWLTNGD